MSYDSNNLMNWIKGGKRISMIRIIIKFIAIFEDVVFIGWWKKRSSECKNKKCVYILLYLNVDE